MPGLVARTLPAFTTRTARTPAQALCAAAPAAIAPVFGAPRHSKRGQLPLGNSARGPVTTSLAVSRQSWSANHRGAVEHLDNDAAQCVVPGSQRRCLDGRPTSTAQAVAGTVAGRVTPTRNARSSASSCSVARVIWPSRSRWSSTRSKAQLTRLPRPRCSRSSHVRASPDLVVSPPNGEMSDSRLRSSVRLMYLHRSIGLT